MTATATAAPVILVKGDDPSLVRDAVVRLVDDLVGDGDSGLMVEEIDAGSDDDDERQAQLRVLVDAAQTPPLLTERRVIVGRGLHKAKADELTRLAAAVAEPLDGVFVVLTWESGAVPKQFAAALASGGGAQVETGPGRNTESWMSEHIAESGLRLDAGAQALLAERLGQDVARLRGLLETLTSAFGPHASIDRDTLEPYIGEAGGLVPWELTDAIEAGDIAGALEKLHRVLGHDSGGALRLMGWLRRYYGQLLALDGADVRDGRDAAALLGLRGSTFPAKKALERARRLGHNRIVSAIELLARADRDLHGERTYPREIADQLVMELLVARLTNLSRTAR